MYFIEYYTENDSDFVEQSPSDRTFTVDGLEPGESVDITVTAYRDEQESTPATLRVTSLADGPVYNFNDIASTAFKYEIAWLSSASITTGFVNRDGSRSFAPSAPVLREQFAAFLYRYAGSPAVELPAKSPFADVPTTATFYKEIVWMAQRGISTGYVEADGTTTFRPSQPVLREQTAAFLFRYDNPDFGTDEQSFTDVPTSAVFYRQIEWLADEGISTGYPGPNGTKTFAPSAPVLREQMAAFLYRYETGPFGQNGVR